MPANPLDQLEAYRRAVTALGGINATAQLLQCSERHSARLYSGASPLHAGILEDIARALIRHSDYCRTLERQISPAFALNLTADQLAGPAPSRARRKGAM